MNSIIRINCKLFVKNALILIIPFICIIIYYLVLANDIYNSNNAVNLVNDLDISSVIYGINNYNKSFLNVSLSFLINYIYVYFIFMIYKFYFDNNKFNIFLRVDYRKWINAIILTIIIVSLILNIFSFFIIILFDYIVLKTISFISFKLFFCSILSKIIVQLLVLLFIKRNNNIGILIVGIILSTIYFFNSYSLIYCMYLLKSYNFFIIVFYQIIIVVLLIWLCIYVKDRKLII